MPTMLQVFSIASSNAAIPINMDGTCVFLAVQALTLARGYGVTVSGSALVMGVGPLIGMFISMSNCLGDVVITTAVANSEKLMDRNVWQRK